MEQIIFVIKDDSFREKVLPSLKSKYKDKELIVVKSVEETNGLPYVELIEYEIPKVDTLSVKTLYDDFIKKERKYRKDQQKLSLKYQNKHFKIAKR